MARELFEIIERPDEFIAGEFVTVKFRYVVGDSGLPEGTKLRLGLPSVGWGEPLVNHKRYWDLDPEDPRKWLHYKRLNTTFELKTASKAFLEPSARQETRPGDDRCIQRWWITFEVIDGGFDPGDEITITYGDRTWGEPGAEVQPVVEPKGDFSFFIQSPDGEVREAEGSPSWIAVKAGPPSRAYLRLPTIVAEPPPSARIHWTDRCGNPPAGRAPDPEVTVERRGDVCRATAEAPGLQVAGNPAIVMESPVEQVYWGDIHGKTSFSGDGLAPIDQYLKYARDFAGLDFTCVTDHSGCLSQSWITTQERAAEYTLDGKFVALKGFEFSYAHGHRNVYFDNHEIEDPWPRERLNLDGARPFFGYLRSRKHELVSIPHHTLVWTNWDIYDQELEPVCEICSMWGCSERTMGEGNTLWDKSCIPGGGAQAALARGYRFGFIGSSDTHSGFPGRQYADRYGFCFSYKAGLAAIRAPELTAKALVDALKARNCYATTGARIYVEFAVNGHRMGSEITSDGRRHVTGRVVGTGQIARIDVVRNNEDWKTLTPGTDDVEIGLVDEGPLTPNTYYYLRIAQADGEMAWASPVWVDKG
jgi:hypothetical protein